LTALLSNYQDELEFDDMMYILACEDYLIFHEFMHDAHQDMVKKQMGRMGRRGGRGHQ
jgi:hypothetical protein